MKQRLWILAMSIVVLAGAGPLVDAKGEQPAFNGCEPVECRHDTSNCDWTCTICKRGDGVGVCAPQPEVE